MAISSEAVERVFQQLQEQTPLIHHLTNTVTINDCANVTLAMGGSPVMATQLLEVEEMAMLADGLVINFGTINDAMFAAMIKAGQTANQKGIPVIFDPVGVGATTYRTNKAKELISTIKVSIIRGNASEISALIGKNTKTRGVDAGAIEIAPEALAKEAAEVLNCLIVISGKEDVITDGRQLVVIDNGDYLLTKVTGTGCMTASLVATAAAVSENWFDGAVIGMATMSLAGEIAAKSLHAGEGLGSFRVKLMDTISTMNAAIWLDGVRQN